MKPEELLGSPLTAEYVPYAVSGTFSLSRHRPPFTYYMVREMLTDPRIIYGLWLIKGPLASRAEVQVVCEDETIRQFLITNINRFWRTSIMIALSAIEWGISASEVMYRYTDGQIQFDKLRYIDPLDVRTVTSKGEICGINVRNIPLRGQVRQQALYIGAPKCMIHLHWREKSPYYGLSRLYGAHVPWWETWSDGGYRDIRRLWYYKNAFEGGVMYHPPGMTRLPSGLLIDNKDLAREMITKKRTGGTLVFPNSFIGDSQNRSWEYEPPTSNSGPEGLLDYGELLRSEELEAMGIPPEIVQSGGNQGFGSSTGRQIPQDAFFAVLQELLQYLVNDLDTYVLRYLVQLNFGPAAASYDLIPLPLTPSEDPENNGNQFQDETGDANSQEEVDALTGKKDESADAEDFEGKKSKFLAGQSKRKKPTSMRAASPPEKSSAGKAEGKWITIGGSPGSGGKHEGGFPVLLDDSGVIRGGGPKSLRGVHVSDSGSHLKRIHSTLPDHKTPKSAPDAARDTYDLPSGDSRLSSILKEFGGDSHEEQAGFYALLKQVHEEHKAKVNESREASPEQAEISLEKKVKHRKTSPEKVRAAIEKNQSEFGSGFDPVAMEKVINDAVSRGTLQTNRDVSRALKSAAAEHREKMPLISEGNDPKTGKPIRRNMVPHEVMEKWLAKKHSKSEDKGGNRSWTTVKKEYSKALGMDEKEFESVADEYMEFKHGEDEHYNSLIGQYYPSNAGVIQAIRKQSKGYEDAFIGIDLKVERAANEHPELGIHSEQDLLDAIRQGKRKIPAKTSDEFLDGLVDYVSKTRGSPDDPLEEKPMHHPDIVHEAARRMTSGSQQDMDTTEGMTWDLDSDRWVPDPDRVPF